MAHYFFDICDDFLSVTDAEGEEWASREAAGDRATRILAEIAAESPLKGGQSNLLANVRDQTGRVVFAATLTIVGKWLDLPANLNLHPASSQQTAHKAMTA